MNSEAVLSNESVDQQAEALIMMAIRETAEFKAMDSRLKEISEGARKVGLASGLARWSN